MCVRSFTSCFNKLLYSHTKREGNKFAHSLARHAIHISDYVMWMDFVPPSSFIVFQVDLVGIS